MYWLFMVDTWVLLALIATAVVFFWVGKLIAERAFVSRERDLRDDAIKRSRAVIGGQFSEQLAPYLPDFPYKPTEVKFLGKPTDFIAFEGLDEKNVTSVTFVEVKSGKASLSKTERSLQKAIESGNVAFSIYNVPEEVTRGTE